MGQSLLTFIVDRCIWSDDGLFCTFGLELCDDGGCVSLSAGSSSSFYVYMALSLTSDIQPTDVIIFWQRKLESFRVVVVVNDLF